MQELAPGLWRWTARHAEWHPGEWGAEVASFAVDAGDAVLLVDPLLPDDDAEVLERLDALGPAAILVTIPYHARSSEALAERYGAPIHGHPAVAKRLRDGSRLEPLDALPGGARAFPIGKPRRHETPIHLPSHRALAFGDAIVTTPEGDLRIWHTDRVDDFFGVSTVDEKKCTGCRLCEDVCGWDAVHIFPLKHEILKDWDQLSEQEKELVKQAREPMTA